ncbi:hypothetical protein EFW58_01557 [Bacillus velezensis]|nr:hypothetical protein EFW58_01557 [Bacillus velezensis]
MRHSKLKAFLHLFKADAAFQKKRGLTIGNPIAIPLTA